MIKFNECRITYNGQTFHINAQIEEGDYFTNVYIDKVIIDDITTYNTTGPSLSPVYQYTSDGNQKSVKLDLNYKDIGGGTLMNRNFFFVWVIAKGTPSSNTPCGEDSALLLCIAFSEGIILNTGMHYVAELADKGRIPQEFISWILDFKALELSIKTGNYNDAVDIWKRIIDVDYNIGSINCNCNG